eukprot:CAMPEP_0185714486 /NCGR_PEP_ID=MMETSP1164-20130828/38899_1 /TAXON_ID=1104430 /ORGANISM="Chrysoreinhardia sp, Strain CCMP2950" /LENGTH=990 /DNA_ID=CAMNT_0028382065 /DNA_START=32 /DNA_END=3001 /DNA_ORIENTATION=+
MRVKIVLKQGTTTQKDDPKGGATSSLRAVVPVDAEAVRLGMTVRELLFAVEERLTDLGAVDGDALFRLGRLELGDGFELDEADLVESVVRDDDTLVAVAQSAWLAAELPRCDTVFADVAEADLLSERDAPRFVAVGATARNRLFVALGDGPGFLAARHQLLGSASTTTTKLHRLRLLDAKTLARMTTGDGRTTGKGSDVVVPLAREHGGDGAPTWALEAGIVRRDDTTWTVRLANRPSHAETATTVEVDVGVVEGRLTRRGEPRWTSDDGASVVEDVALPDTVYEGPRYVDREEAVSSSTQQQPPAENANVAEGGDAAVVIIAQSHRFATELYQEMVGSSALRQVIALNVRVFNKGDKTYDVEDVAASFFARKEGAAAASGVVVTTQLATRKGAAHYAPEADRTVSVEARKTKDLGVLASVEIPLDERTHCWDPASGRLHRSLRGIVDAVVVTFRGFDGETRTLRIPIEDAMDEAPENRTPRPKSLALPSRALAVKALKTTDDALLAFVTCDDTDCEGRLSWAACVASDAKGDFLKVTRPPGRSASGSYGGWISLRPADFAKLAFRAELGAGDEATEWRTGEIEIEDLRWRDARPRAGVSTIRVVALVRARLSATAHKVVYGLRVELATNTGRTVDYLRLPPLRRNRKYRRDVGAAGIFLCSARRAEAYPTLASSFPRRVFLHLRTPRLHDTLLRVSSSLSHTSLHKFGDSLYTQQHQQQQHQRPPLHLPSITTSQCNDTHGTPVFLKSRALVTTTALSSAVSAAIARLTARSAALWVQIERRDGRRRRGFSWGRVPRGGRVVGRGCFRGVLPADDEAVHLAGGLRRSLRGVFFRRGPRRLVEGAAARREPRDGAREDRLEVGDARPLHDRGHHLGLLVGGRLAERDVDERRRERRRHELLGHPFRRGGLALDDVRALEPRPSGGGEHVGHVRHRLRREQPRRPARLADIICDHAERRVVAGALQVVEVLVPPLKVLDVEDDDQEQRIGG